MLIMRFFVYTLLSLSILVPFPVSAENNPPADITEANAELNPAPVTRTPTNNPMIVAPPSLPPAPPAPKRVIDKKFIVVMSALGGAESLRFTTHKLVLDNEFAAGAPWVTSVPSSPHMVAKYGGIFAAELLVAYELKKPHNWLPGDKMIRKLWWASPAVLAIIHIKNGIRSMRTQGPGGCTSVAECEGQQ